MYINFKTQRGHASRIYEGLVDTKTGKVIARSNTHAARPHEVHTNVIKKVNPFPHTDEDFVILAARRALKEAIK